MAQCVAIPEQAESLGTQEVPQVVAEKIKATLFGQCVGDTLGLLTEFMTKDEAKEYYGKKPKSLKYDKKVPDFHRSCWENGDWTDDTDQMILILQSLLYNKGEVVVTDFAKRMKRWLRRGFPEFGDFGGMGIGMTTTKVLDNPEYTKDPHKLVIDLHRWFIEKFLRGHYGLWAISLSQFLLHEVEQAAYIVWNASQRNLAANGCVMRTSILGLHQWNDIEKVTENALNIGKCTHSDPRCQASVIAVTTCIAKMIQYVAQRDTSSKKMPLEDIIKQSYDNACQVLETDEQKKELWKYISCKKLKNLALDEDGKIGYTYKCMGSGFWAVRQDNFEKAMIKLIMAGGDADTNGAVAGAMLACKLGLDAIPHQWISDLLHKDAMLDLYNKFIRLQSELSLPVEERTSYDDLTLSLKL